MSAPESTDRRRHLPAVHELIEQELVAAYGHARVSAAARAVVAEARAQGQLAASLDAGVLEQLRTRLRARLAEQLSPVINATGVVIHTNLGRAPWSVRAIDAAVGAAGYTTVELDRHSGQRGRRGAEVEERLCALSGAEAALVVNNCAAALLLALRVLAKDRRVLVSRAELVEIGGGFRVPDVLEESGAKLSEIGTTNRTHLRDYQAALGPDVAAILRVHQSNFRQVGFVAEVGVRELASLGPPVLVDAGSGAFFDISGEPLVKSQLQAGAALVCFSGDKLLGGPQAGILVGQAPLIERLRQQPLFRALRPDKVTLAALQATLDDWLGGNEVPVLQMIRADLQTLREAVHAWQRALPSGVESRVVEVEGAIGGGSVPGRSFSSVALGITSPDPEALRQALLRQDPVVLGRIQHGQLLLDARTVVPLGHGEALLRALERALASLPHEGSVV